MKTSAAGKAFTRASEGCVLKAYPDPGSGGDPWTIGFGHTAGVKPGMTCTRPEAVRWFEADNALAEAAVTRLVQVPLTQGQFDALTDFVFNLGEARLKKSTLLRKLNAGDYDGAGREFPRWVHAGQKILPGLVTRARGRVDLWTSTPTTIVHAPAPKGWLWALLKRIFG